MAGSERKRTTTVERRTRRSVTNSHAGTGSGSSSGVRRDEIARRAYEIYLSRGATHGGDFDDWLQAEREIARR
jgi:hypothetical protein